MLDAREITSQVWIEFGSISGSFSPNRVYLSKFGTLCPRIARIVELGGVISLKRCSRSAIPPQETSGSPLRRRAAGSYLFAMRL